MLPIAIISAEVLLNLGNLQKFSIIGRPSSKIKSPYVADIITTTFSYSSNPFYQLYNDEVTKVKHKASNKATVQAQKTIAENLRENHEVHLAHAPAVRVRVVIRVRVMVRITSSKVPNVF